jgi:hypothetical protein
MSFVIKNSKKYNPDERITLDAQHSNVLDTFEKKENNKNKLQNKLNILNKKLIRINKEILKHEKSFNETDNNDFIMIKLTKYQTQSNIIKDITDIEKQILDITTKKNKYILGSLKYVRQYHNIDKQTNVHNKQMKKKKIKLENFFKLESDNDSDSDNNTNNKAIILNNYLREFDPNYQDRKSIYNTSTDKEYMWCTDCNIEKSLIQNEGILICTSCGMSEKAIIDGTKPSYNDSSQQDINNFTYKKMNHFSECINQSQGKETTTIPKEIYSILLEEIKKDEIKYYELTNDKVREYLRLYKLNKYYEHIPYIINKLTGIDSPSFNGILQDKLKNMFKEIQTPYKKYKPCNRKNFLSYNYIFYKFLELLNEPEHAKRYSLLKSDDKLQNMDDVWENICNDLGWTFIASNK